MRYNALSPASLVIQAPEIRLFMFFGGNKAGALVKELDPTNFFALEQAQQVEILEKLNAFVTSQSKLDQVVAAGLLPTFGRLVQGAHAAKVLPTTHHELMRFLAIFAKVPGFKVKMGVQANLCDILIHEIGELINTVHTLVDSSEAAALAQRSRSRDVKMNVKKKQQQPNDYSFKLEFGDGPIGLVLTPEDLKKKTGAIIKAITPDSLSMKEKLIRKGDRIVGINGNMFSKTPCSIIDKSVNKSKRPVNINFIGKRTSNEIKELDAELIERIERKKNARLTQDLVSSGKDIEQIAERKKKKMGDSYEYEATFDKGPLGLDLRSRRRDGRGTTIHSIVLGSQAFKIGGIKVGHTLVAINDKDVRNDFAQETLRLLKNIPRPVKIRFRGVELLRPPGYEYKEVFQAGPMGLELEPRDIKTLNGAIIVGIAPDGQADRSGEIHEGHQILSVDGVECKNRSLKEIKKLLISAKRPVVLGFQIRDFEKENAQLKVLEFEAAKRVEDALRQKRKAIKVVTIEKGPHGLILEKIPGQNLGVQIQKTARNSEGSLHPDVKPLLSIIDVNGEDFTKRTLVPAQKKLQKMSYPMTITLQDPWLTHYHAGMKLQVADGEHRIEWSEKNLSIDFTLKPNPGSSYGAIVGTMKPEIQQGYGAIKGLQVGWPLLRINDVDCSKLTLVKIDEWFKKASIFSNRPLSMTFMKLSEEEVKAAEAKGVKLKIAGISSAVGKKKLNLRGLLWSMAPKAKKEIKMPVNAELALEVIPEYSNVLFELCEAPECIEAACSEESYEMLARGLSIFVKCKSRSEGVVRPVLLRLCSLMIRSSSGITNFLNAHKLLRMWIDFLWQEAQVAALHDLVDLLWVVTQSEHVLSHKDYEPVYIFRVCVNKLNEMGEKMLKDKDKGENALKNIGDMCSFIFDHREYQERILNSHYNKPGLAGLWVLLAKCRKFELISVLTDLVAKTHLNADSDLYAIQPKSPKAVAIPPFNAVHILVMSMHRSSLHNSLVVFEYEAIFEAGPLGILLDTRPGRRNGVVVHGVRDGSQADLMETIEVGDYLAFVGEANCEKWPLSRVMESLKSAERPLKLKFHKPNVSAEDPIDKAEFIGKFSSGPMGIRLDRIPGLDFGAIVTGVDTKSQASSIERLNINDRIVAINGKSVEQNTLEEIIKSLHVAKRPMLVTFRDPDPKSEFDRIADVQLMAASKLIGAILSYQTSPGALAIRLTKLRQEKAAEKTKKKIGGKLLAKLKKTENKLGDDEDKKIALEHSLDGIMRVEDAEILSEIIFQRILKSPHPSYDLTFYLFAIIEIICCIDPERLSNLSVPAYIHIALQEEDNVECEYIPHVLEATTHSMDNIVRRYGSPIAEKLIMNGVVTVFSNGFNRCKQVSNMPEDYPFLNGDLAVLKWNLELAKLLVSVGSIHSEQIEVVLSESAKQFIPTLYYLSDVLRILIKLENEHVHMLQEQGDFDHDGIIDDPEILEDVQACQERLKILGTIQALFYEAIYQFAKNNVSCSKELCDSKFIPATVNALSSMAVMNTDLSCQAIFALSRLLLLLTFDEDRLDPILSDRGALSMVRAACRTFSRVLASNDAYWDQFGGQCLLLQNIAQVTGQVLRLIDIDHVLDHHGGKPIARPLTALIVQLLGRILSVTDKKYEKDMHGAVLAFVLILYEMASINVFRLMLTETKAPLVLCDTMTSTGFPKQVYITAAGAFFNITCNKFTVVELQDPSEGNVLLRLANCIYTRAEGPHCQALLMSSVRNIVCGSRPSAIKAAKACRFLVPTLLVYLGEAAHISGLHSLDTTKVFTSDDEAFLPSMASEALELLKLVTHINTVDLKEARDRVLLGRKLFPVGLMSMSTLEELRKIRAEAKNMEKEERLKKKTFRNRREVRKIEDMSITLDDRDVLFDEYDNVSGKHRLIEQASIRENDTLNIVKWVDYEFWAHDMEKKGVVKQHRQQIWDEEHRGLEQYQMTEIFAKDETAVKKSHYMETITTHSAIDVNHSAPVDEDFLEVDALFDLNHTIKQQQRRERELIREKLMTIRDESINKTKASKSQLGRLAQNMMKAEFYGAKMNSFSPDSMKPFSTKFEDTLASDDVFQHTSPEFETTMNGHFRSQNIERILKYESI